MFRYATDDRHAAAGQQNGAPIKRMTHRGAVTASIVGLFGYQIWSNTLFNSERTL